MESVREYLVGVTSAAVLCGILSTISDGKTSGAMVKLLCGVFLSLIVIFPLSDIHLIELDVENHNRLTEGQLASEMGTDYAKQAKMQIIKQRTEAYILDKAKLYNLDVRVEVTLSRNETPAPCAVVIWGQASPYAKVQLGNMLETELGIPKENQRWMESGSG